jgi:hypothetical protein
MRSQASSPPQNSSASECERESFASHWVTAHPARKQPRQRRSKQIEGREAKSSQRDHEANSKRVRTRQFGKLTKRVKGHSDTTGVRGNDSQGDHTSVSNCDRTCKLQSLWSVKRQTTSRPNAKKKIFQNCFLNKRRHKAVFSERAT